MVFIREVQQYALRICEIFRKSRNAVLRVRYAGTECVEISCLGIFPTHIDFSSRALLF